MKSNQVNEWLQVMASLGVVLGLMFVALELRENSKVATEQGISAMSGAYSNFLSRLDDPTARDVLIVVDARRRDTRASVMLAFL
jgi:hypothetical protein